MATYRCFNTGLKKTTSVSRSPGWNPFAFFHFSNMPPGLDRSLLPNRDMIFEFTLVPSQADPSKMAAADIMLVYDYSGRAAATPERDRDRGDFRGPAAERESRQLITDREQRSPVLLERFPPQPAPAERPRPPDIEDVED